MKIIMKKKNTLGEALLLIEEYDEDADSLDTSTEYITEDIALEQLAEIIADIYIKQIDQSNSEKTATQALDAE